VIQERNPRCVVASLSGFGATGPQAGRASYDIIAQATGGLMSLTGFADGPPLRGGGALGDFLGGLYLALGIVSGILDRDRRGHGRVLDLSNQDAIFATTDSAATIFETLGVRSERVGNQHPFAAPYGAFRATDGWVAIATASNRLFRRLCEAMGREELSADERFQNHRGRAAHRAQINGIVEDWVSRHTCAEVLSTLGPGGADVPCARVSSPDELIEDPQLLHRGMIERHEHPSLGEIVFHGNPLQFSDALPRARVLAPRLGEHNREIYAELGLGDQDLERLAEQKII
ncbi:MAG: CaiB/BaiF CoA-transferase family protein, partial [Verrucomicrobiota bacterium]|nr:CaiB/BaiF CoA-transferase family protein [Verrucomicrobiota bacterium]